MLLFFDQVEGFSAPVRNPDGFLSYGKRVVQLFEPDCGSFLSLDFHSFDSLAVNTFMMH